jgi:hypothetical protein
MQTIENRLAALERGMARWKIVAGALAVTLIGFYLAGAGPYPAPQPGRPVAKPLTQPAVAPAPPIPDTLRAKRFEVVNEAGRVLARLEGNDWGARVQFFNAAGKIVADGGSTPDGGSQFAVYDDADNPTDTASISSARSEADVIAEDKHGKVQISTGTAPGEAGETPRGASILEHGRVVWLANPRR